MKKGGEREKKISYVGPRLLKNVLRFTSRFSLHFPLSPHMVYSMPIDDTLPIGQA